MDIAALKAQINIVDIISRYIPLKKSGANYIAPCPFHNEKSASFVVSEAKQIYHCFGCGVGGDFIKFLQEYKKLDFAEALREICDILGIEYETKNARDSFYKEALSVCEKVNDLFKSNLKVESEKNAKIRQYLANRGLNDEDLAYFDIGLAPLAFEITKILNNKEKKIACDLGILSFKDRYHCAFSNRITIAIRNATYKICGFSGRTHGYDNFSNAPKYLNSKASRIFNKSQLLYLLPNAKSAIKATQSVLIVEGYFDGISAFKLGIKNTVASCGTALNKEHIAQILALGQDIAFDLLFDSDEAGQKAALRACETFFANGIFNVKILKLQGFKDLGEILQERVKINDTSEFKLENYAKSYNAFAFFTQEKLNAAPLQRKDKELENIKNLINAQGFFIKNHLCEILAKLLKIPKEQILSTQIAQEAPQNTLLNLQKSVFKSVLNDKACEFIAVEHIESYELGEFKQSFEAFICDGSLDEKSRALSLDESVLILSRDEFVRGMKFLRRASLEALLSKYRAEKNTQAMIKIREKLAALEA